MALFLVTPPASEPLTVAEVRAHLRVDSGNAEPSPATAPTLALAGLGAGNVANGAHRLAVSYVTADGETPTGPLSAPLTVVDKTVDGQLAVSAIPVGGSAVTTIKFWMPLVGTMAPLLYAGSVANGVTTATINLAEGSLGAQAPATNTTADPELVAWIGAARGLCETITHRAFIAQTWDLKLDGFLNYSAVTGSGAIWFPKAPLISVTSLNYIDTNGATQTWAASNYTVDAPTGPTARQGRLTPAWSIYYPVARTVPNAVVVRFVAGYGAAAAVPAPIKSAMKLLIGNWYKNREAGQIIRGSADILPFGVDALLWPFKSF